MEEDEDPIVKEIPVYLSKRLADHLYVFQYPLCASNRDSDTDNVTKCSIKPENQEVKLEVELNSSSTNFDLSKAEQIAINVDGFNEKTTDLMFPSEYMDKITYTSTKSIEDCSKYAVGLSNGKEIHLCPVKAMLQIRPSFPYLDKTDKRKKPSDVNEGDAEEPVEEPQAVTVKFAKGDNDRWKKSRETSYKYLTQKSAEEAWIPTEWFNHDSDIAELERYKMQTEVTDNIGSALNLPARQYIRQLVPEDKEEKIVMPSLPSHVLSLHSLRALPLLEQCRLLLKDAKLLTFQQMLLLLAGGEGLNVETLLRTVPQVGVLVRGNWVVRSEVLYPKDTLSAISGVPADIMCRARDYVLHLFTQTQYVDRRKVSTVIKIPAEEVKEIFVGVAKLKYNRGWELLLAADADFVAKYPETVQRQQMLWDQKAKQLREHLKEKEPPASAKRQRRKSKSVSEDCGGAAAAAAASGRTKRDSSLSSDNESGTERGHSNKKSPVAAARKRHKSEKSCALGAAPGPAPAAVASCSNAKDPT